MLKIVIGASLALAFTACASFAAQDGWMSATSEPTTLSKRSKPRVPGGSGCDDPRDLIEHPECRGLKIEEPMTLSKRSKPRVPGGSGCDDPRDLIEHPECRG